MNENLNLFIQVNFCFLIAMSIVLLIELVHKDFRFFPKVFLIAFIIVNLVAGIVILIMPLYEKIMQL